MKKFIAVLAFFTVTLLSTDAAFAQEARQNFQAIAKHKTHEITKQFKLDGKGQRTVYNAYMLRERKLAAMQNNNAKTAADTKAIDAELYTKLKTVLTDEQIAKLKQMAIDNAKNKKMKS